ncbi:hypothetical protein LA52FAK_25260 [Desulforhopalus sp. 52FAK]
MVHVNINQYTETGEQLLINPGFRGGLDGWQLEGNRSAIVKDNVGSVMINVLDSVASVQLFQKLDPALLGERVVLRSTVKSEGIIGGAKGWEKGRVAFVQYVEGKAMYSTPHVVVALDGTHDWAEYNQVFNILPEVSNVIVSLQLGHASGELNVKELSLFRVNINPLYSVVRFVVFGIWAVFIIFVFISSIIASVDNKTSSCAVILVIGAIILGTTVPASLKNSAKSEIVSHAKASVDKLVEYGGTTTADLTATLSTKKWLSVDITKVAHFMLFGLLGGVLFLYRGTRTIWQILIDVTILACGSELIQLFIEGRSGLVGDVFIDLAGAGCAIVLLTICTNRQSFTN